MVSWKQEKVRHCVVGGGWLMVGEEGEGNDNSLIIHSSCPSQLPIYDVVSSYTHTGTGQLRAFTSHFTIADKNMSRLAEHVNTETRTLRVY